MPITNECIKLLQNMVDEYALKGTNEPHFKAIFSLLKELQLALMQNKKNYNEDRVIAYLSNTSVIANQSPIFNSVLRSFLINYQQQTQALDSMYDDGLQLKSQLDESWGGASANKTQAEHPSLFFMELRQAIQLRKDRLAKNESERARLIK